MKRLPFCNHSAFAGFSLAALISACVDGEFVLAMAWCVIGCQALSLAARRSKEPAA